MFKSIKALFTGSGGGSGQQRDSSFKSSSITTRSLSSGGNGGSNRSLASTGGSSRTLGSGSGSGTGSNGSGSGRGPSLNAAAFAASADGSGDRHEGRRALSMNIRRHHNLVRQTPERLDSRFLNVILDQLRGGTEDVDDGMTRVPLEQRNQSGGAARRGSASSTSMTPEFRPVAVGLTGGLPSTTVGRMAPIDGASQFGGSTSSSTARGSDQSLSTFGGLSFAPSFAPMNVPETIEEGNEAESSQEGSPPASMSSQHSPPTDPSGKQPFMAAPEWSAWNDDSQQQLGKEGPPPEPYAPYYYRGHPLNSAFLSRLLLIILCFCLSLIFTIVLGGGRLGNDAATFMYKSTVVEDGSIGVWLPPSAGGASTSPGTDTSWHPDAGDFPNLASMDIELPIAIERNFAENSDPYPKGTRSDMPVYWQIPRTGGSLVRRIFGNCLHLVQASQLGAERNSEGDLKTYQTTTGVHFVNVDTTTPTGIQRAKNLDLASSASVDVAFTPLIVPMAEACNSRHQGRPFALFRHPIEREVDIFYYEKSNSAVLAEMSLLEYIQSGRISNNWMTRFLSNKFTGTLTEDDLHVAMDILRRKFVIGLEEKMKESILRFERYFGWGLHATQEMGRCQDDELLAHANELDQEIPRGSAEWYLIMAQNEYDLQLYDYVRYLYDVQGGGIAR